MYLWGFSAGVLGSRRALGRWGEDGAAQASRRAPRRPGPACKDILFLCCIIVLCPSVGQVVCVFTCVCVL